MPTPEEIAKAEADAKAKAATPGANTKAQLKAKAEAELKAREGTPAKTTPKMDETVEGGVYTVDGVIVNAEGEPL